MIFDNSEGLPLLIAEKLQYEPLIILDELLFSKLKEQYETQNKLERRKKILIGLENSYRKMLEFKKQKNSVVVVLREDKITRFKPE